ncbi:hypothetical protein CAOG_05092 [Capsaspora owczarzaki ATCC 30864]|uniref:hypothetical protein n=1 Tax=Capsaspora owczarzaki (strain ATCC 30864) TaxID=595528 RepID=UPI0001FE45AB|nr:hypothetical protein CAOG_05092 [Capsaspora owczarzaki ATCC 30864]|eukprot:XP_004346777.1 hypothetical protein CAOG_05092 [Capsaspora owczarzaki ATCC 30864]
MASGSNKFAGLDVDDTEPTSAASAAGADPAKAAKNKKKKSKKKEKKQADRSEKARQLMQDLEPGFMGSLTPEMETALKEFKAKFAAQIAEFKLTDHDCLRYLRGRDFAVAEAGNLMLKAERWRAEYRPQEIPITDCAYWLEGQVSMHCEARDRKGRPILLTRVQHWSKKDTNYGAGIIMYCIERSINQLMTPGQVESFTYIFDNTNFSWLQADNGVIFTMLKMFKEVYIERCGALIIMNAPWIFGAFWNLVKGWLDARTASKVIFLGGDYKEKIQLFVDPSQLPPDLGGTFQSNAKAWTRPELRKAGIDLPDSQALERPKDMSAILRAIIKGAPAEAAAPPTPSPDAVAALSAGHSGGFVGDDDDDDDADE